MCNSARKKRIKTLKRNHFAVNFASKLEMFYFIYY
jgi:hypothetical protein